MDEHRDTAGKMQGALVLCVLSAVLFATLFAVSETLCVLLTWAVGGVALYRSATRLPGLSAPPPPEEEPLSTDVLAVQSDEVVRVERGRSGFVAVYTDEGRYNSVDQLTDEDTP